MNFSLIPAKSHVRRNGSTDGSSQLRLSIVGESVSEGLGSLAENAGFLVSPGLHAGVKVQITREDGRLDRNKLDEFSVTLTLDQAQALFTALRDEINLISNVANIRNDRSSGA
jgi:hypothetical protein